MNAPLTLSDVRRLFDYEDGQLIWREQIGRGRIGASAGTMNAVSHTQCIKIRGRMHTRARLVWAWHHGEWPKGFIWHRNRSSNDDRIENLLDLTLLEFSIARQQGNDHDHLPGTTRTDTGWQAQGSDTHLGTYKTAGEAHAAYRHAHIRKYGSASPYAPGGSEMLFLTDIERAPPPSYFFANGKSAANFSERANHGPR